MFGKGKKEEEKEKMKKCFCSDCKGEKEWEDEVIQTHARGEKYKKEKQDYIDEKVKLTEKELLAEILWSLTEVRHDTILGRLDDIIINTDDQLNQKIRQRDKFP